MDKNAAYPKAIAELKALGILPESVELRQVKYLNNIVEQDHRFIKRLVLDLYLGQGLLQKIDMRQNAREQHAMMGLHPAIQGFAQVRQLGS